MPILKMFRKSPFEPLRHHMLKVKESVTLVPQMFAKLLAGDHAGLETLAQQVFKTEHEADLIKNEIRQRLPKGIFLSVVREDLLGHLRLQDDMADTAEDIAVIMTLKPLVLPESLKEQTTEYLSRVTAVCDLTFEATEQLKELADIGFAADPVERVLERVTKVEQAEWEADKAQYTLAKQLFALESEMSPVDIYLWFRIFGLLGELANHANKTCDWMRRMLAK